MSTNRMCLSCHRYQQEYALRSLANNYRRPVIGFEEDFDALGRREVQVGIERGCGW